MMPQPPSRESRNFKTWMAIVLFLAAVLSVFFYRSFIPGLTLFSNDGPLGRLSAEYHRLPDSFTGVWNDLNGMGYREQGALPNISYGLRLLIGNLAFSKFYAPLALLLAGLGAWCFFRESGLSKAACYLGALAAALNTDFFSTACWGIAATPITVGMAFFAMAAILRSGNKRGWIWCILAGMAVGLGLADGADIGAIFSMVVGGFIIVESWFSEMTTAQKVGLIAKRLSIVVISSALFAAQPISALLDTQVKDVAGMDEALKDKTEHWNWATQWSLPKVETLSLVMPGLFGYRSDTPDAGVYWGEIGRDAKWDKYLASGQQGPKPMEFIRYTGSSIYAGVVVVLVSLWAILHSFLGKNSFYALIERKRLWYWGILLFISLLLSYGHYAPFYRIIYRLPFFSTIRNPIKFMEVVNFAFLILFAYGVEGLWRGYMQDSKTKQLPKAVLNFDKRWLIGCLCVFGLSLVAWYQYSAHLTDLQEYLRGVMFEGAKPRAISEFSVAQVGWFVLFFGFAIVLMSMTLLGAFSGKDAVWGIRILGLLVGLDFYFANRPWIVYLDYADKYAGNPVLQMLEDKPYEHRVVVIPYVRAGQSSTLGDLYRLEWLQHYFQLKNIQSSDVVQMSRIPEDMKIYGEGLKSNPTNASLASLLRRYQLTNVKYLMGPPGFERIVDEQLHSSQRVTNLATFKIVRKTTTESPRYYEQLTATLTPAGDYGLFEYLDALPRAKLYATWECNTNGAATIAKLIDPDFDPQKTLLVKESLPPPSTNLQNGTYSSGVNIVKYEPKRVVIDATNAAASVLLLNDRYDSNWKVTVDGKPGDILHCNYLMRGVYLEPGNHVVEYRFSPPKGGIYISIATIISGFGLLCYVAIPRKGTDQPTIPSAPPEPTQPVPEQKTATVNPKKSKNQEAKQKR